MDVRTDGHSAPAAAAGPQESGRRWLEALEGLDRAAAAGAIAARDGTGRTLAPGHPSEVLLSEEPTPALAARALAAIRIVERAGIDAMPQARQALARGSASADPDVRRAVRRAAHEVAQGACALSRAALAGLLAHRGADAKGRADALRRAPRGGGGAPRERRPRRDRVGRRRWSTTWWRTPATGWTGSGGPCSAPATARFGGAPERAAEEPGPGASASSIPWPRCAPAARRSARWSSPTRRTTCGRGSWSAGTASRSAPSRG